MIEINLWVLISQIINFVILFLILNKFLFKPISEVIVKRQEEIAKMQEDTAEENTKAKDLKKECQQRLNSINGEIEELRKQKISEIQDQVDSIINNAHIKANTFMEEAELEVLLERQRAWKELHSDVIKLATSAAEKIVGQSLNDEVHRNLIDQAIVKLEKELPDCEPEHHNSQHKPQQYAEEFFASIDRNGLKPQFNDFNAFIKIFNEDEDFRNLLENPTILAEKKVELINKVFAGNIKKEVVDFIIHLINEKHVGLLNKISEEVRHLFHNRRCIKGIRIRTKVPLTQEEKELLYRVITKKFGSIEVEEVIDHNLVGGLIVQLNGQVVDASVGAKVKQLRESLRKVEEHWHRQLADAPSLALF